MGVKVGQLYQELTIDDKKFNKKLGRAKSKTSKLSKTMKKGFAVAATSAVAIGAALAGAATKGVKEFMKYENQMNEVFTLMPEASDKMKNQLNDDLKSFSEEMGVLTDDATPALYQAISAGVPKDNVFSFLEQAQKASVGAITDLETSVDALTSVTNTYGTENITAKETSDLLFTAVKQGKTTFEELARNISDVAPIASSLGIEFSNITAALSTMTAQGVPTAKATTQLKTAMVELSKEGSKAGKAFADIAGKSFQDFISEGGNMQEAMVLMEEAARKNDTTVGNMFGSVEAGQAALALTGKGAKKFKEDLDEMENSAGATDEAYKTMDESLSRSFDKIAAAANVLWIEIGEELQPIVADFANWIKDNMPQIKETVVAVFKGIVNAIYLGIDAYKAIKEFITGFVSTNRSNLDAIFGDYEEIFNAITGIIQVFIDWGTTIWDTYGKDIKKIIGTLFNALKTIFETKIKVIKNVLQGVLDLMQGDFGGFKKNMKEAAQALWDGVVEVFNGVWSLLKQPLQNIRTKIKESWSELIAKMKQIGADIIDGVITGIKDKITAVTDTIKNVGGSLWTSFKEAIDADSPSKLFAKGGKFMMQGLANGITANVGKPLAATEETTEKIGKKLNDFWENMAQYAKDAGITIKSVTQDMANSIVDMFDSNYQAELAFKEKTAKIKDDFKEQIQDLINKRDEELKAFGDNAEEKTKINKKYSELIADVKEAERDELDDTKVAYEESRKSIKSVLKGMLLDVITMLQKKVLAEKLAGIATAWAQAPATFGASLAAIPGIIAQGAAAMAGFEALKAGIRSFHEGGIVPGPLGQERLILAKSGETVTPAGSNSSASGGGGGYGTANIYFQVDGKTLARIVKQPLLNEIRVKGGVQY